MGFELWNSGRLTLFRKLHATRMEALLEGMAMWSRGQTCFAPTSTSRHCTKESTMLNIGMYKQCSIIHHLIRQQGIKLLFEWRWRPYRWIISSTSPWITSEESPSCKHRTFKKTKLFVSVHGILWTGWYKPAVGWQERWNLTLWKTFKTTVKKIMCIYIYMCVCK